MESVLEALKDGKWHTIREISQEARMPEFKIEIIADFLADYSFLELNKKERRAKVSSIFLDFLKNTRPLSNIKPT